MMSYNFRVIYKKSCSTFKFSRIGFYNKDKFIGGFTLRGCKNVTTLQLMFLGISFKLVPEKNRIFINHYLYKNLYD